MTANEFAVVVVIILLLFVVRSAYAVFIKRQSARAEQKKRVEEERQRQEQNEEENKRLQNEIITKLNVTISAGQGVLVRNKELVEKFLQIAETKVSIIDEYGDENWEALPDEIQVCLKKIANRENFKIDWKSFSRDKARDFDAAILSKDWTRLISLNFLAPFLNKVDLSIYWLYNKLEAMFKEYHAARSKQSTLSGDALRSLSGVEFETHIARILKKAGFEVGGTPATGDQGADLIATRDGRKIVIQAKRYEGTVGNKAVQEVTGAVKYYGGDEGWVITNSTFTPSAKALAQKANVRLIDGPRLATMERLIDKSEK
jgi:HJR/Mrr/RecB family endonuclease/cell division protein FtsB